MVQPKAISQQLSTANETDRQSVCVYVRIVLTQKCLELGPLQNGGAAWNIPESLQYNLVNCHLTCMSVITQNTLLKQKWYC